MAEEWTTVSDGTVEQETKIVFEEIGDEFTGIYLGLRELTDRESGNKYHQARFRDPETSEICFCRANWSLKEGLEKVPLNNLCKVIYVDDVDTGRESPMRVYSVLVPKGAAQATTSNAQGSSRPVRRAVRASKTPGKSETTKP